MAKLQSPNLIADFTYHNNCPFLSNCSYSMSGAYANVGNSTATGANVKFTFYSQPDDTGQVLCATTYILGDVSAQSVATLSSVSCDGSSSTQTQSATYQFAWG
ncbi:hypothetical protein AUF62_00920 [archaeon 13_1_20CM_52_20]|nr:MAG: hypothetical protein AUF62_00920 [archaeon 13_1_20CM_52_20]